MMPGLHWKTGRQAARLIYGTLTKKNWKCFGGKWSERNWNGSTVMWKIKIQKQTVIREIEASDQRIWKTTT